MKRIDVIFEPIRDNAKTPAYAHGEEDAGADLYVSKIFAKFDGILQEVNAESYPLKPFETIACGTGLKYEIPEGYEFDILPTSGNSLKTHLRVANSPGLIDCGFRDEIKVIIQNVSQQMESVSIGDKIAQLVIREVIQGNFKQGKVSDNTKRGSNGFGSTGIVGEKKEERKLKYNVGDMVVLRDDLKDRVFYDGTPYIKEMESLKKCLYRIDEIRNYEKLDIENYFIDGWVVTDAMIDHEKTEYLNTFSPEEQIFLNAFSDDIKYIVRSNFCGGDSIELYKLKPTQDAYGRWFSSDDEEIIGIDALGGKFENLEMNKPIRINF